MSAESLIGKTARGQAVYSPSHPSYAHLEKVRMVGVDKAQLGQLARQAHPHYRAVDHEEASVMHHSRQNFHAARAHEAASEAMSKADGGMVPAYDSNLSWVYEGADPGLTLQDAAGAITAVTLTWSPQDHLDNAVLQHCLAQSLGESGQPEDLEKQAVCAAAAYMHFAAAGVDPTSGAVGASIAQSPMAKSLARLARAELGKSADKASEAELTGLVSKALDPKVLRPIKPRTPSQIGQTRSGKPIFDVYHHPAHKDFSKEDWADAGRAVGRQTMAINNKIMRTPVKKSEGDVVKGNKPLGAAFSHARKVAAKTGGGKAKEREVAQRYLSKKGHGKMAEKSMADGELEKGKGKGSRGGVIVGFAPNGSPIYSGHRVRSSKARKEAVAEAKKDDTNKSLTARVSNEGDDAVHKLLMKAQGGKGEGSRGGHIIGHSKKNGHPIYARSAASSRIYKDMGADDHITARDLHKELSDHHAAKAKESDIADHERQHHRQSASFHKKQSYGHAKEYAKLFGHYRNELTNGALAARASHNAPSSKSKEKAYLAGQEKVGSARELYDGKPFKKSSEAEMILTMNFDGGGHGAKLAKSLDGLHPSDGLHQMGAQFAQKHPKMSASDHMSESSKYAKAGQPHMAIGHLMASSYKSAVAKKSMAADVLKEFLSKAQPKTYSFVKHTDAKYAPVIAASKATPHSIKGPGNKKLGEATIAAFPHFTAKDHMKAAQRHGNKGANYKAPSVGGAEHAERGHIYAAKVLQSKMGKSLNKAEGNGEGSRGGKVIAHLSNGKPVYAHRMRFYSNKKIGNSVHDEPSGAEEHAENVRMHNVKKVVRAHPNFTSDDHWAAADHLSGLETGDGSNKDAHLAYQKRAHQRAAKIKDTSKFLAPAKMAKSSILGKASGPAAAPDEFNNLLKASGLTMWA